MTEKESLEETLYLIGMRLGRKLRKKDFPIKKDGVPSYNTCMRRGISLRRINERIEYSIFENADARCENCNTNLSFDKRLNKYCSRSCSASKNNLGVTRHGESPENTCLYCNIKLRRASALYCSSECNVNHKYKENVRKWLNGELSGCKGKVKNTKTFVRKYIFETRGTACSECGWDEVHPDDGLPLTQLDYIDGDADNTTPENLRVLCPNCHSKTPTYLRRNKKSSRDRKISGCS